VVLSCEISMHIDHTTPAYINNHTNIWGSWYDTSTGSWGYACCHSTVHISYCTGQAGIEAAAASSAKNLLASSKPIETVPEPAETTQEMPKDAEDRRRAAKNAFGKERVGEGEIQIDNERLVQALKEEKKRKARGDDDGRLGKRAKGDEPYEVSEEQLGKEQRQMPLVHVLTTFAEAYRMTRNRMEDPMANYVDAEV
jgi:pre-mRNA-processing factor SLU7